MSEHRKIPATVVTGFLGAGKTTLIRHLLKTANGKRLALIINEFGDIGIDGEVLKACGNEDCGEEDIVELANGCLCCTVADDFVPTIEGLLARDPLPDHIVIETSGLALPKPLVRAFGWPEIRTRLTVDGVVAVVDGPAVDAGVFAADPNAVQAQREADEALEELAEGERAARVVRRVLVLGVDRDEEEVDLRAVERARRDLARLSGDGEGVRELRANCAGIAQK